MLADGPFFVLGFFTSCDVSSIRTPSKIAHGAEELIESRCLHQDGSASVSEDLMSGALKRQCLWGPTTLSNDNNVRKKKAVPYHR